MPRCELYYHPVFLEHDVGSHPECPERLLAIIARLERSGLWTEDRLRIPEAIDPAFLEEIHAPAMIRAVREACARGVAFLDADTPVCERSWDAALHAAGAAWLAGRRIARGEAQRALCLVRPPGHHATPTQAMGFCLFNNVALAARAMRREGLGRVAIIDFDVHHGNGTQDAFYEDPSVFFLSAHRYGDFYPGTGSAGERGRGAGLGTTCNLPFPLGASRQAYRERFAEALETQVAPFAPEALLISAGFDAHEADPIGGLCLHDEDFAWLTAHIVALAQKCCQGRVLSTLEGGYDLDRLACCVEAHLRALEA